MKMHSQIPFTDSFHRFLSQIPFADFCINYFPFKWYYLYVVVEDCQLSSRSRKAKDIFVKDNEIQIYPNPTTNTLRINSKNVLEKIEIFNFMGVMVQGEYSPDTEIDISMLAPNVYFLRTTRADGGIAIVKFIKVMD